LPAASRAVDGSVEQRLGAGHQRPAIRGVGPSTGAMLRSQSPDLVAQEHAAWVISTGLARATARAAAATAVPAGKGKRAGQPAHPREISFTAARRAIITTTRAGTATASLPAPAVTASRDRVLAGLGRRRVDADRHRHRGRTTKARLGFPPGGPRIPAQTAVAQISIRRPVEPAARPERQPGRHHARPPQSLSVEHPDRRTGKRSDVPEHAITLNYMALTPAWRNMSALLDDSRCNI
jgi:hypothetical protein